MKGIKMSEEKLDKALQLLTAIYDILSKAIKENRKVTMNINMQLDTDEDFYNGDKK